MSTPVFCRINGKLAHFEAATDDHARAIAAVEMELLYRRTPADGAVLALIETPQDDAA